LEGILAGALVPVFFYGLQGLKQGSKVFHRLKEESIGLLVLLCALLLGLDFHLADWHLGTIISKYLIVFAAASSGPGAGAAFGAVAGLLPGTSDFGRFMLPGIYAVSGMFGGFFRNFGKVGVLIGFLAGNLIYGFSLHDEQVFLDFMKTSSLALTLFLLTPWGFVQQLNPTVDEEGMVSCCKEVPGRVRKRLEVLSELFRELSSSLDRPGPSKEEQERTKVEELLHSLVEEVCRNCSLYGVCWEKALYQTYQGLLQWLSIYEKEGEGARDHIPQELRKRCKKTKELATAFSCFISMQKSLIFWKQQAKRDRSLLAAQLREVATVISSAAEDLKQPLEAMKEWEEAIVQELCHEGLLPLQVRIRLEKGQHLEIDLDLEPCSFPRKDCEEILPSLVGSLVGQSLVLGENTCARREKREVCSFRLFSTPALRATLGFSQQTKEGSKACGDSFLGVPLDSGKLPLILSDGMGSGFEASRESGIAVRLLHQLLAVDFQLPLAVQTVNAMLVGRDGEDTFATIDLALLDLIQGNVEFVKIGAMPSLLFQDGGIALVESHTLPVGIVESIQIEPLRYDLQHGALLVMATDGVWAGGGKAGQESWLGAFVSSHSYLEPQELAERIVEKARELQGGSARDDLTALVVRIQ
ncbi:MAG TPA: SpoIIE family protein phosphatase, partial [Clostridia bacterium]|nr:SpoIIE family protein phosphatase [Clostridia bacterium]